MSEQSRRRLPGAVIALGFASLFTDVATEMIFPLLPVFVVSLGGGAAFLGLVEGSANATASFLKLLSGYWADRVRRRTKIVLLGYGIAAFARPFVALATAPWHVLAVRVTDRVGKGVRTSPRDAIIASSVSKEDTGRAFGFHHAMDHAGAVAGPLVATALLAWGLSVREVFWIAAIPGALALVAVLLVREPPAPTLAPASHEAPSNGLPASFRSYLAIVFVFGLGSSSDAFLLLRARECGLEVGMIPLLWAVFNLSKLVSSHVGGAWSDRVPRVRMVIAGWLVYALTYFAFGLASAPWQIWTLFVFYGLHYGLTEPAEKALVRDLAPAALRGRAFGQYHFVLGITAIPAGLITGFLWDEHGATAALNVGAALALVAAALLVPWSRR
jgi:MFS family permease